MANERAINVEALHHQIDEYWRIAWREGRENRVHDTPEGDAERVRLEIDRLIQALRSPYQGEVNRNALKRVHRKLAEEGGGTWATYMMIEIASAYGDLELVPDDEDIAAALEPSHVR